MNILILENNAERVREFKKKMQHAKFAWNAADFIQIALTEDVWNIVLLDHMPKGEGEEGSKVIDWIVENEPQIRNIIVHTEEGVTGAEMVQRLSKNQYQASYVPYTMMINNMEKING